MQWRSDNMHKQAKYQIHVVKKEQFEKKIKLISGYSFKGMSCIN